ncbi:N-acetyltransferase [Planotetraspora thailandica]|uniref:N-acetyltransferase n=2 Tax=Planotetraspora thailandica TaxID=487172 RepID=A0A8J3XWN0_9ACTN|nr:N-acetyltransferase [Planotetraspora thailandica]
MRPITGRDELDLFTRFPYALNSELADDLDAGRRRTDWMWVALHGNRLLGRAAWWGRPDSADPLYLDVFDIDDDAGSARIDIGAQLLRTTMAAALPPGATPPEYIRFVPPDWRDGEQSRRVVDGRMAALEQVGARLFVERLRLEWRAGTPIPPASRRLEFRPVHDDEEILALMTSAMDGTLDAHSRDDMTRMPAREAAELHFHDELAGYSSPREWWRIATLPGGEPVGFVFPARNDYNPIIAYIGVVPAHRGNGYIHDILAEGTRILAEQDVPRIRAATDLGNQPMANAFARAGYLTYERAITMTWS